MTWLHRVARSQRRLEIVTLAFEDDLELCALQLSSIGQLFDLRRVPKVTVIFNGQDNAALRCEFASLLGNRIPKSLHKKLVFLDADTLCQKPLGWRGQQALKLMIAKRVKTRLYLVLDAKNHFIQRCGPEIFFSERNRPKTWLEPPSEAMRKLLLSSLDYFGMQSDGAIANAMPTITPYLFYRKKVIGLVDEVERRESISFEDAFLTRMKGVSEFWLYYAWLLYSERRPRRLYDHAPKICQTLFATWPTDHAVANRMIDDLDRFSMFGLHRLRLSQLTTKQRSAILDRWRRSGLPIPEALTGKLMDAAPESSACKI